MLDDRSRNQPAGSGMVSEQMFTDQVMLLMGAGSVNTVIAAGGRLSPSAIRATAGSTPSAPR